MIAAVGATLRAASRTIGGASLVANHVANCVESHGEKFAAKFPANFAMQTSARRPGQRCGKTFRARPSRDESLDLARRARASARRGRAFARNAPAREARRGNVETRVPSATAGQTTAGQATAGLEIATQEIETPLIAIRGNERRASDSLQASSAAAAANAMRGQRAAVTLDDLTPYAQTRRVRTLRVRARSVRALIAHAGNSGRRKAPPDASRISAARVVAGQDSDSGRAALAHAARVVAARRIAGQIADCGLIQCPAIESDSKRGRGKTARRSGLIGSARAAKPMAIVREVTKTRALSARKAGVRSLKAAAAGQRNESPRGFLCGSLARGGLRVGV